MRSRSGRPFARSLKSDSKVGCSMRSCTASSLYTFNQVVDLIFSNNHLALILDISRSGTDNQIRKSRFPRGIYEKVASGSSPGVLPDGVIHLPKSFSSEPSSVPSLLRRTWR